MLKKILRREGYYEIKSGKQDRDRQIFNKKKNPFVRLKNYIGIAPIILFSLFFIALTVYLIGLLSVSFADFINIYISTYFRKILAIITGIFPVSVAEAFLYTLPVVIGIIIWRAIVASRYESWKPFIRFFTLSLGLILLFQCGFVFTFGMGYRGSGLEDRMNINLPGEVSAEELEYSANILVEQINNLAPQVDFLPSGESIMPYSFEDLNDKLNEAWKVVAKKYPAFAKEGYSSTVKPVAYSEGLSNLHILGVYTFFTGEANVNVEFPQYHLPFTMAHEMAHQRGIAREEEANFVAYLVCMNSDDPYIRYSGYMNIFDEVKGELSKSDKDKYSAVYAKLSNDVKGEYEAYRTFFQKYVESKAAQVHDDINDKYLKSQGESAGTKSYALVVRFAVAIGDALSNGDI